MGILQFGWDMVIAAFLIILIHSAVVRVRRELRRRAERDRKSLEGEQRQQLYRSVVSVATRSKSPPAPPPL